ncbi:ISAs1 family transposase [Fuchsiella alkaliacetigena]|uniref:ISAs1 family transposase n=1 Tax=Fuchsiella alkaliacetigena TaxID=957042 RepID=UPI00200AC9B7|nr:ISAs1 family transposase [Fuchsiella alkaliacetigena]MCK8825571.1 ISAs1 family transposase [Fuchsiella alkaliacetigena]
MNDLDKLGDYFSSVTDPRGDRGKMYNLQEILVIAICAVICGGDSFESMSAFGEGKKDWLNKFLELENGIPSPDTFGRVFSMLDPIEFKNAFTK